MISAYKLVLARIKVCIVYDHVLAKHSNLTSPYLFPAFEQNKSMVRSRLDPVVLPPIDNACLTGTRETVLRSIDSWIQSGEKNVLWITGQPGSGKTTIAAGIFAREKSGW